MKLSIVLVFFLRSGMENLYTGVSLKAVDGVEASDALHRQEIQMNKDKKIGDCPLLPGGLLEIGYNVPVVYVDRDYLFRIKAIFSSLVAGRWCRVVG